MAVIASGSAEDDNNTPVISSRCIIPLRDSARRSLPNVMAEAIVYSQDEETGPMDLVIASSISRDANGYTRSAAYAIRRKAALVSATILKPTQKTSLGMKFAAQNGRVMISSVLHSSQGGTAFLLSKSPFEVGDVILSINGTKCTGMDPSSVNRLLRQEQSGSLTIVAHRPTGDSTLIETMIEKPSKDSNLGIALKQNSRGVLKVSRVDLDGIFAHSLLNVGDKVLAVNQVDCHGLDATSALHIMENADRYVTVMTENLHTTRVVVAVDVDASAQEEANMPGAGQARTHASSRAGSSLVADNPGRKIVPAILCCLFIAILVVCILQAFLRQGGDNYHNSDRVDSDDQYY